MIKPFESISSIHKWISFSVASRTVCGRFFMLLVLAALMTACGNKKDSEAPSSEPTSVKSAEAEPAKQKSILVFSAASLTDVVTEIASAFEASHGVRTKLNLASSGTLARQMEEGGAPEVFLSASKKWADYVEDRGLSKKEYRKEIAKNDLVLIAPKDSALKVSVIDSALDWTALLGDGRLSLGDPAHVPAGKYAKEALEHFKWFDGLKDKMLPAKDVRSALMVVEMGEAPVGIVYRTDADKSGKVRILGAFPESSHKPIVYVATACKTDVAALDFFNYLSSPETDAIWKKFGFRK